MGVKSDRWIAERCSGQQPMIEPFVGKSVSKEPDGRSVISYGPSSYGYDVRCGLDFLLFTNVNTAVVDPKKLPESAFVKVQGEIGTPVIIPPNSFALTYSLEYMRVPRDVLVVCLGKSTYARCGIIVNVTPLEPEWEGNVTLELSNTTPLPAAVYPGEGIAQFIFLGADLELRAEGTGSPATYLRGGSVSGFVELEREVCETSYKDRGGKYQGQTNITLPRMR